jgi:hypothetical protein
MFNIWTKKTSKYALNITLKANKIKSKNAYIQEIFSFLQNMLKYADYLITYNIINTMYIFHVSIYVYIVNSCMNFCFFFF